MDISNHFSTTKLYGSTVKSVAGTSEKSKWKLTDSLKEKIVELAKKDAQHNVYMGNEFETYKKAGQLSEQVSVGGFAFSFG